MRSRLVSGLVLCCLWLITAIPNARGADTAHFQAIQLTKLPESVPLPDMRLPNVVGKAISLQSFRDEHFLYAPPQARR